MLRDIKSHFAQKSPFRHGIVHNVFPFHACRARKTAQDFGDAAQTNHWIIERALLLTFLLHVLVTCIGWEVASGFECDQQKVNVQFFQIEIYWTIVPMVKYI